MGGVGARGAAHRGRRVCEKLTENGDQKCRFRSGFKSQYKPG